MIRMSALLVAGMMAAINSLNAAEIVEVPINALHPTQGFIAYDQINYTLQRYRIDRQKLFDDLCEVWGQGDDATVTDISKADDRSSFVCVLSSQPGARVQDMKTAIRGPGGQLYLTDGHHTFSTFIEFEGMGPEFVVPVVITHDRSELNETEFWQWLQDSSLTWLYDAQGQMISATHIPTRLGKQSMANDPYRAALYFLRGRIWNRPHPAMPFAEFYWAQHIRSLPHLQQPERHSSLDWLRWLERITGHMLALPDDTRIGPNGENPDAMGRMAARDIGGLDSLICDRGEPGRLAMALAARGIPATCQELGQHAEHAIVLPAMTAESGQVLAVIEIPAGSVEKWEMNKSRPGLLEWERESDADGNESLRTIRYLPYPFNYGALPGTNAAREESGDGDPLDVVVLGPALTTGATVAVRVLGRLAMIDHGEIDDKILAVIADDPLYQHIESVADLNSHFPGITLIIETWFQYYKGPGSDVTGLVWH